MKLLVAAAVLIVTHRAFASCTSQGEILPWGRHVRAVCFEEGVERDVFPSPDKRKSVVAEMGIGFHVLENDRSVDLPAGANDTFYPSELAWSPRSDRFFVNNGDGSGLDGWTLQIFRIEGSVVKTEPDFNGLVVAAFRKSVGCPAGAADPNVRGIGWSADGSKVFAFAQSTVKDSCGVQGRFRGVVLSITNGKIVRFYSETETRLIFRDLLPGNMR